MSVGQLCGLSLGCGLLQVRGQHPLPDPCLRVQRTLQAVAAQQLAGPRLPRLRQPPVLIRQVQVEVYGVLSLQRRRRARLVDQPGVLEQASAFLQAILYFLIHFYV